MSAKINVPELRFGEFSGEWEEKKYGEIYSFYTTNSFSRDNLNYETKNVRNIHYGDIHTKFSSLFHLENELVPFINQDVELNKIKDESYCQIGDLVIADASEDYADIGKTIEIMSLNNEKTLAGLHTFLARPNKHDMALGYAGYLLNSWKTRKQVMTIAQGTKVLSLSTTRLSKIILNIPSKSEQEKIASFLSSVDSKIEQLSKKKTLLEQYKKGVMQKIFSQTLRFKDDDGSEFPEWVEKKLGEIFEYKNGGSFENDVVENGKYKLITLNSIDIKGNLKKEHKRINLNNDSLDKNDLIMVLSDVAHGNFLGLTAIIPNDNMYILNQRMGALKIQTNDNILFLRIFINFNQKYFKLHGQGSSQQNLSKGDILKFKINLPSLKEQTKIADFLSSLDKKIELTDKELNATKEFKKALLQKMFV